MTDAFSQKRVRITAALAAAVTTASDSAESVEAVRQALVGDEPTAEEAAELKAQTAERASTLELELRTYLETLLGAAKQPGATIESVGVGALLDVAIALSVAGVADYNACFCLLEDLFDTQVISEAEQLWGLVEKRAAALTPFLGAGPECTRAKLTLIRTCNELLRRLSKSKNTNFCGRILMLLAYVLPLSERSGVNLKGISATSELDVDEAEPDDGMPREAGAVAAAADEAPAASVDFAFYKTFWELQQAFSKPTSVLGEAWGMTVKRLEEVLQVFGSFEGTEAARRGRILAHAGRASGRQRAADTASYVPCAAISRSFSSVSPLRAVRSNAQ